MGAMKAMRRGCLACLGVAVVLAAQGCGGGSSGSKSSGGGGAEGSGSGTLIINDPVAPATLDASANVCGFEDDWVNNFYRQLVRVGRKPGPYPATTVQDATKIQPDVAKSWTRSPDGLTYTFHLDPNAKFNDGSQINSAAVKFSFERAAKLKSCGSSFWGAERDMKEIKLSTPDATTVVAHLKTPNELLLGAWAFPGPTSIYDPKVVAQHPDKAGQAVNPYWANHIAGGGGPFRLDQYAPGSKIVMSRNPAYTGPTPARTKQVIANFGMSASTLLLQARSGAADVTFGLTPDDLVSLEGNKAMRVLKFPVQQFYSLGLNNKRPPFDNLKVREALSYAVPYKDLLSKVLRGYGESYYGPIAHTLPHFNPKLSAPLSYDLDKAKALLAESGAALPMNITMVLQQGAQIPAAMAAIIQATWKPLGVNVKIDTLGVTAYNSTVGAQKAQTFIRIDGPGVSDAGWLLGYDMICGGPFNLSTICIPEADKLLAQAESTSDEAKQQQLYDQITTLWRAQTPKIVLAHINQGIVLSNKVKQYDWSVVAPEEVHGISK
jgi:peptide/nickel transport system substrate-binding protein